MSRFLAPFAAILIMAAAPAPRGVPVPLMAQPGTPLDTAARKLSGADLAESRMAGERPLVLVGTAKLSSDPKDRLALFVQLQSARECGSAGCSTSVYLWKNGAYKQVLDGVGGKLVVGSGRSKGMADLLTEKSRFVWNGSEYRDVAAAPPVDLRPRRRV